MKILHQIEISSRCNLACKYCAHPIMTRPKQDMPYEVYERSLYWASKFVKKYGQDELNLAGTGESTLHPRFAEYLDMAREAVGNACCIIFATNGGAVTKEIARACARNNVKVWLSLHKLEIAAEAFRLLTDFCVLEDVSVHPMTGSLDWAGQIDWPVTVPPGSCAWADYNWMFAASNGDILRCCQDVTGISKIATIFDDLDVIELDRSPLCGKCVYEYI